jgi:hypothetical protein
MRRGCVLTMLGASWSLALWLLGASPAGAASVETLLMPGKVADSHAKFEATCSNCHDRSNAHSQTSLCLDCHKQIASDIGRHLGYHGHVPNAGAGECRACHTEHKGRGADIVQLDRAHFDHRLTDLPLIGAHAGLACEGCHKPHVPWRAVPTACGGCHQADDVHNGQFTQSCGDCHSAEAWSGGRFDHVTTRFDLTGAHTTVACNACHIAGRYKSTPDTCLGCHATDDVHRGSRGTQCGRCHVTKEWKSAKFDHLKETGFALLGAHADVDCVACHRSGNYQQKIPKDCAGCHRSDDAHAARFGSKCEDCHENTRWQVTRYDHAARHQFALLGAHARIACDTCHTAIAATQKLGKECADCHRSEDPHGGKLKDDCGSCHGQTSWRNDLAFDHDITSFALLGLHRVVSCAQCHSTLAFSGTASSCVGCHARDDVHKGGLGGKCESCHSPNGWALWRFDHAREAHFPLLGAHARLQCADCHRDPPGTGRMSQLCAACHQKDDRHLGQYGLHCERCHSTDSWKGARIQ